MAPKCICRRILIANAFLVVYLEPREHVWWLQNVCPIYVEQNLKIETDVVVCECTA